MALIKVILGLVALALSTNLPAHVPTIGREATIGDDLKFQLEPLDYSPDLNISNVLIRPKTFDSSKKYPVLLVLHTCGGPKGRSVRQMHYWVKAASEAGYLTMQVDSITPRGHRSNCKPRPVEDGRLLKDVYDAAENISTLTFVNKARIFTTGGSLGAMTGMLAASPSITREVTKSKFRFRANIALFPGCEYRGGNLYIQRDVDRPLLVLMGGKDTDTPPENCLHHFESLKARGAPIEWHLYPTASHNWDNPDTHGFSKTTPDGKHTTYYYDADVTEDSRKKTFEFLERFQ
jgi:dienelactone hydrolase